MTIYTVLAYRPDGLDTCRGCEMGRSESAFEFKVFDNLDDAAKFWGEKNFEDRHSAREYCSWDLTLLVDGTTDYAYTIEQTLRKAAGDHNDYLEKVKQDKEQAEKDAVEEKAEAARKAAEEKKEEAERAEFRRLRLKYLDGVE